MVRNRQVQTRSSLKWLKSIFSWKIAIILVSKSSIRNNETYFHFSTVISVRQFIRKQISSK